MARFFDYLDYKDVLPGEVSFAGLGEYFPQDPGSKTAYVAAKRFKFEPEEQDSLFARFLALQANPNSLVEQKMKMPPKFALFSALASSGNNQ